MITPFEADVLAHTSSNGRYVTGDTRVIEMGGRGLLSDYGPQELAGGMHFLTLSLKGQVALRVWREAQPKPPKSKRRRQTPAFEGWRASAIAR